MGKQKYSTFDKIKRSQKGLSSKRLHLSSDWKMATATISSFRISIRKVTGRVDKGRSPAFASPIH